MSDTQDRPHGLSVIIPVHNGAGGLDRCLASLAQSSVRDFECIVVDDASTDDSRAVAARRGATVLALEHRGGPARARNRGAERARGDILVFLDADVCAHVDTLARLGAHLREDPGVSAVMGSYDDRPADPHLVSQYKNLFHHYVHQRSRTEAWTFWAGCGAIRRQVFLDAGGFDESYTRPSIEDIELGIRLHTRGHRIDLDPRIQVTHLKRWTLWDLVRTDVLRRGVPWFLLMLRNRRMPSDLNVTVTHRLSVALVFVLVLLCVLSIGSSMRIPFAPRPQQLLPLAAPAIVIIAVLLLWLNGDLYRFFGRQRGAAFAAATVPLHWLYYAYCGVAVGLGLSVHLWERIAGRPRRRDPSCARAVRWRR